MANDPRAVRTENTPIILAWGMPYEAEGPLTDATLWLSGGLTLLLWTALVLVLTSV